jgi:hypothetical protein
MSRSYTPSPLMRLHGVQRDCFTFTKPSYIPVRHKKRLVIYFHKRALKNNIFLASGCRHSTVAMLFTEKLPEDTYELTGFDPRQRQRIFPLASASRPALGPIQPPVQWVPGVLSPGVKRGRGVMLTTRPHLVPKLRMSRSYISSHPKRLLGV